MSRDPHPHKIMIMSTANLRSYRAVALVVYWSRHGDKSAARKEDAEPLAATLKAAAKQRPEGVGGPVITGYTYLMHGIFTLWVKYPHKRFI